MYDVLNTSALPMFNTTSKEKLYSPTKKMGSSSVWCAAGQAMEQYTLKIRREIERCLDHFKNPDGPSLFIRLCMIRRKGDKTNPTIMVYCANRETSKKFEASVRHSGILDRYPGLQLSSCALPPKATSVPRPLLDTQCRADSPGASAGDGIGTKTSDTDARRISGPRMGRRLEFIVSSEAGMRVKHATGGLIVRIGDELYQVTAFDSTGDTAESSWTSKVSRDPEKCELDKLSEAGDSGFEQIFTSDKSLLLEARVERDEKYYIGGQHILTREAICSPVDAAGAGIEHSLMWKYQDVPLTTPTRMKPSTTSRAESSYYTLVKLSELEISEASNIVLGGDGHIPPKIEAFDIAKIRTEPASILVITPRGPISGTALPDVASLRLHGSSQFQTVHAVILSEPSEPGDCGSAVIDGETGSCYGHIMLGVEGDVVCYMVPASDTLADIVLKFGNLPSLQLDRRADTKHSPTVERWKCVNPRGNTDCHPLAPLGKCISCRSGKLYSERSRAAAHLRRRHFPNNPQRKDENSGRNDNARHSRLPATELKNWTREIMVTSLYARVMQAESDSDSDYESDVDDTDDEPEKEPLSASPTVNMPDRNPNLEVENEKLRCHSEKMKHEMEVLEGDIDVLMVDREELKQELEYLRKKLREQEA